MKITTGCISRNTLIQGVVLGLIMGPLTYFLGMGSGLIWNCCAMFAAPFVVDAMRPVVHFEPNEVQARERCRAQCGHAAAIAIPVSIIVIVLVIAFTASPISIP